MLLLTIISTAAGSSNNGVGLTPTLGFSTWNWRMTCTTRAMVTPQVEAMVKRGLVKAGYTMFMADCAGPSRNAVDRSITLPDTQWPGGVENWNAYLHASGMKAGFYSDYGVHGCCSCPWQTNGQGANQSFGDAGYIARDMAELAQWKTDYIKVDSCQPVNWRGGVPDDAAQYGKFRDAIRATGRPIVYSIVGFKGSIALAAGKGYAWLNQTGNSWRTSQDILYAWSKIMVNLDAQENVPGIEQLAGPGGFNDLDMLMAFNPKANLSAIEDASHLALWAILKSPLLISTDVAALSADELAMLTNARMLSISQDALGVQAARVAPSAHFAPGGAVYGASREDGYATGPHQWWSAESAADASTTDVVRFRNEASGLCLASSDSGVGVELSACSAQQMSAVGWRWEPAVPASGGCARIGSAAHPGQCLSLSPVTGTSEFMRATLVACSGAGQWARPAAKYLNLTVDSLGSCTYPALNLDAAARSTTNVFAGPLEGGNRWAALLFNRGDANATITLDFGLLPGVDQEAVQVTELEATEVWSGATLGSSVGTLTSKPLRKHESLFVILSLI